MRVNTVCVDVDISSAEFKNAGELTKAGNVLKSPLMYSLVVLPSVVYTDPMTGAGVTIQGQKTLLSMPVQQNGQQAAKAWVESVRQGSTVGAVFGGALKAGKDRTVNLSASEREVQTFSPAFRRPRPANFAVLSGRSKALEDRFIVVEERYPLPGKSGEWGSNIVPVFVPFLEDGDLQKLDSCAVLVTGQIALMTVRTIRTLVIVASDLFPGRITR